MASFSDKDGDGDPMIPQLPPICSFHQQYRHEDGWTDHYGALFVAAEYAGCTLPAKYRVEGLWQHGCLGPWDAVTPGTLAFNAPGAQDRPLYVARQEQADFLCANGYPFARAIGMPIIYTPPSNLVRVPRSVLVMPTHTLTGDRFPDRSAFERYADEIKEWTDDFDHVTVCVHPSCQRNGLWISEFHARGIPIVVGASTNDANALRRMRALFEQYETVTTNGWGSHIAYALAFGAKVALAGVCPARDIKDMMRDEVWAADIRSFELCMSDDFQRKRREFLQAFAVPPRDAVANQALGDWLVGTSHRLSPAEMAAVLKTLVLPVADPREALRQVRDERRKAAALLAAEGRRTEAIQAYLDLAVEAVQTRNTLHLHESLLLLAGDLEALDPARAKVLRQQAELVASRMAARTAA